MVDRVIALAKEGDSHALGSLLEGYRAYLRMLACVQIGRRLRSKLDADDLIQEAFLRAHQAIGRFRGTTEEEFLSWLRGILAHVVADQIRRYHGTERRDPKLERALEFEFERSSEGFVRVLAAPTSSPSQRLVRHERAVRLAAALERLPPASREVLLLRHFQDLSFPEIARRMGRTLDGVKNLWIRALGRLRREADFHDE
jgi:RNA polymerase sigma-70 factor (ECF subfamily)